MKNRVRKLVHIQADKLKPNPDNWRLHPDAQRTALRSILDEVGFADAILARDTGDGYEIIDGHLRAEEAGKAKVPVLVLDVSEDEARYILTTLDPLSAIAATDDERLSGLIDSQDIAGDLLDTLGLLGEEDAESNDSPDKKEYREDPYELPKSYEIIVECASENEQKALYDRLDKEGYRCRVLSI